MLLDSWLSPRASRRRAYLALSSLFLLGLLWLSHRVAFDAPFYFDTLSHLEERSNLHLVDLSLASLSDAVRLDFDQAIYRPIPMLSLGLTHLGFGLDPSAYRVGNLLIHWVASLAACWLFCSILRTPRIARAHPEVSRRALPIAVLAALVWSLHPVHTNVVTYVIQRMASLCGLFSFLCAASYLKCRCTTTGFSWSWAFATVLLFLAAIACKENAVTLLPVLLASEFVLLDEPPSARVRNLVRFAWSFVLVSTILIAIWKMERIFGLLANVDRAFTISERLLTEARLQLDYGRLLILPDPSRLILTPDIEISRGVLQPPATGLALVVILILLTSAIWLARKKPLYSFSILWFFLHQLTEGTIIPLELYFEHRLYIPSAVPFLGVVSFLFLWAAKTRPTAALAVCVLVFYLASEVWATHTRNTVWSDPVVFWSDVVEKAPRSSRAHHNLGREFLLVERYDDAEKELLLAMKKERSKDWLIHILLARIAYEKSQREAAREQLEASLSLVKKTNWEAPRRLGMLAIQEGNLDEAEQYLKMSLKQKRSDGETWRFLGVVHLLRGEIDEAAEAVGTALRYRPTHAESWNTWGAIHFKRKNYAVAKDSFEKAIVYDPDNESYRNNLRKVLEELGKSDTVTVE